MQKIACEILAMATKTAPEAEVYITQSESTPVVFEANRLKSIQSKESMSIALRVIKDGRIGYASSNKNDARWLVESALETSEFGADAVYSLPNKETYHELECLDQEVAQVSLPQMISQVEKMISSLLMHSPKLICEASVSRNTHTTYIANSKGLEASFSKSIFSVGIEGTLVNGSDMLFVGDSDSSCHPITNIDRITASTCLQLKRSKSLAKIKSGSYPVVFTPDGFSSALVAPLMAGFNGKLVLEGASPLKDRLGEKIFDSKLELCDDATIPFSPGSCPFDDEGVPSKKLQLIKNEVAQSFFYDLKTASLANTCSTGHGMRHGGLPTPSPRAFVIGCGKTPVEEIISSIKEGLLVEYVMGATQGNILGGDFSGNILLGYKIENGHVVGRVKDTMIHGNTYALLKSVDAIGNDGRWLGGRLFCPSFLFPAVSIASK